MNSRHTNTHTRHSIESLVIGHFPTKTSAEYPNRQFLAPASFQVQELKLRSAFPSRINPHHRPPDRPWFTPAIGVARPSTEVVHRK
ncbi:Canalicular multispecific organic anion transporter 2 [Fusarium oxysporum f. sp. albedinis]|nr:Canalicular multispecific organic anion transporter 2 [Fusarium oxysporum f. sp. albedinis]